MWITVGRQKSVEISDQTVGRILNMYPEEELVRRSVFENAFETGAIEFGDLKAESEKILIPWQLFLLDETNLTKEIDHIDRMRADKVSAKLIAKRKGAGDVTSKRIIDRLIRLQNFISEKVALPDNRYCGSLRGKTDIQAINHMLAFFEIDVDTFRGYRTKAEALRYLIARIEGKNINVSQGVLTNKILPTWQVVSNSIYKNTSGFVIKDDKMPFIFIPSEINPDETDGRQIYTLVYLVFLIGLNEYSYFIEKDFKAKALSAQGVQGKVYRLTSELLLPAKTTEPLRETNVTTAVRDDLSTRYKITPSAVVVTLRRRRIISKPVYDSLLPAAYIPRKDPDTKYGNPRIETSVRKFCGKHSFDHINSAIRSGSLTNIQAQYLLFGSVNKKTFKKYRHHLKI